MRNLSRHERSVHINMQAIDIPGRGLLEPHHLVLDLNGTIALDGQLLPGVAERVAALRDQMTIKCFPSNERYRLRPGERGYSFWVSRPMESKAQ